MSLIKDIYKDYENNKGRYSITSPTFNKSNRVQPKKFINKGIDFDKTKHKEIEHIKVKKYIEINKLDKFV